MRKIDLHIHTIAAPEGKDVAFEFDISKFKEYVDTAGLHAVAVTNHNLFNLEQFNEIADALQNVKVFPGIEIDYEDGHMLLIAENDDLDDFNTRCALVEAEHSANGKVRHAKLIEIFEDVSKYLLIPHHDKDPKIGRVHIDVLRDEITAGEVGSQKRFHRLLKKQDELVPVLFSDIRVKSSLDVSTVQGRQTYLKTNAEELSLSAIKAALQDKDKVFLSRTENHDFFEIFSDGQQLSHGLNVILGNRSSGKTHFLNKIVEMLGSDEKGVKYIKQFELTKIDEKEFNDLLEKQGGFVREEYLSAFKPVVQNVLEIDRSLTLQKIEEFTNSLVLYANNEQLQDEYSRAVLFNQRKLPVKRDGGINILIDAIKALLDSDSHKDVILKHLPEASLKAVLNELALQMKIITLDRLKREWVNELVSDISDGLQSRSSRPPVKHNDLSIYTVKLEKEKIRRFNAVAKAVKTNQTIRKEKKGKFTVEAYVRPYSGTQEVKNESKTNDISFKDAYEHYSDPFRYLSILKTKNLDKASLYKYFCKVRYQVLNEYQKQVSGGEMTEFNLLQRLQDAFQYEMLLVDEPESSFDNVFLKENVNKILKDISRELPVIVVTHNNTVGMLLKPDYIIYTQREIEEGEDKYYVYSGSPGEKTFSTADGSRMVDSHAILLEALEAGANAYNDRKRMYDTYKKN
ncbi:hypothetical protein K2P47_00270 [Patescibacteria group bacterium]|nr:hypothetical protein [Patescibacteria group bacterium]